MYEIVNMYFLGKVDLFFYCNETKTYRHQKALGRNVLKNENPWCFNW